MEHAFKLFSYVAQEKHNRNNLNSIVSINISDKKDIYWRICNLCFFSNRRHTCKNELFRTVQNVKIR